MLERYVFPWLTRAENLHNQDEISIRVDRVGDGARLLADGIAVASAARAPDIIPHLIHVLDESVLKQLTDLRAVHAGVVLWRGRALLLPGMSHAGKSSLVAALLQQGATYFSDEYALIDAEGKVHPYARPLMVREDCPEQVPVLAREYGAQIGDAPAEVGWILFLQFEPAAGWQIARLSQGEALLGLLRNTPHILTESPDMIDKFQRAIARAGCYAGKRAEAEQAAGEILSWIANS